MKAKKFYKVTIYSDFEGVTLTGEFKAEDAETAAEKAQGSYSVELDCNPEDIQVLNVEEVNNGYGYPEYIIKILRWQGGFRTYDASHDNQLQAMEPDTVFERILQWNGILHYDRAIKEWIKDIYHIDVQRS